jgi:hypothetical protein
MAKKKSAVRKKTPARDLESMFGARALELLAGEVDVSSLTVEEIAERIADLRRSKVEKF